MLSTFWLLSHNKVEIIGLDIDLFSYVQLKAVVYFHYFVRELILDFLQLVKREPTPEVDFSKDT